MAKKRPSPVALVQSYFADGPGAESAGLLAAVTDRAARQNQLDNQAEPPVLPGSTTIPQNTQSPTAGKSAVEPSDDSSNKTSHATTDATSYEVILHPAKQAANHPVSEPVKPLADKQPLSYGTLLDRVIVSQSDRQTVSQSNGRTVTPPYSETVIPLHSDTALQSDSQAVTQSTIEVVSQSSYQTPETVDVVPQHNYQTVSYQTIPLDVLTLPYNQAVILEYLIGAGGVTNARAISDATHIGIPSVRDAIARLIRRGFLPNPVTIKNAAFQGFSYILNQSMVAHFQAAGGLEQRSYTQAPNRLIVDRQAVSGSHCGTVSQSDGLTAISSSRLNQLTTTPAPQTVTLSDGKTVTPSAITPSHSQTARPSDSTPSDGLANFILAGPTGMYWEGEGLQERQAKTWCDQFEIERSQMKQQLEWARFDLVANNKAAEVKKDAISWFFGVLRQTGGCYPKPQNYKSPAEIRAEQMEQAAREAADARERQVAAEQEMAFQRIMSEPDGSAYQALLAKVNDFAKEMGGKALEAAMREEFERSVN